MNNPCLRIVVWLSGMFSFAILATRLIPYNDSQLQAFMAAPENCGGECVFGIHPGTTTLSEAMDYLNAHAWVESAQLSAPGAGYGQIRWTWSGQQPAVIDESRPGRITFYWDREEQNAPELNDSIIQTVAIYTRLRIDSMQGWFGDPDSGTANIRPDGDVGYSAAYHIRGRTIALTTVLPCPARLMHYWNARTHLSMSIGQGTSTYMPPTEMVKLC